MKYEYPAIRYWQLDDCDDKKSIICMTAPCDEILSWAGIPRKAESIISDVEGDEKIEIHGYQRQQDKNRIQSLVEFYGSNDNVIPTSLLLATRFDDSVEFFNTGGITDFGGSRAELGKVVISNDLDKNDKLSILYKNLADVLITRNISLSNVSIPSDIVNKYKRRAIELCDKYEFNVDFDDDINSDLDENDTYNPDSHLIEFYKEVKIRQLICEQESALEYLDGVLGFTREMIVDYLSPLTVVDGQHRLISANEALKYIVDDKMQQDDFINLVSEHGSADEAEKYLIRKHRRTFSATLICNTDWSEHVFQFVVVNQKVKPISKSLLSSIIGTSLNSDEVDNIQDRLERAGIEIDDYKVMARLLEDNLSPFKGSVKKGYSSDRFSENQKLDWSVLNSLAKDFRNLKNLQPFHRRGTGELVFYTEWRSQFLSSSQLLDNHAKKIGCDDELLAWGHPTNGLWLDIFRYFYSVAKDKLSDEDNNLCAWRNPNESNLFNGVSLRALLADFGDYLFNKEAAPDKLEDFKAIVDDYFTKIRKDFFGREWKLVGKRIDRINQMNLAQYLQTHRQTGKVDGKWKIF